MAFDQRQLRAFLAIIDTGSLGRAAAAAGLTQPALSRMVGEMERRLGQRLFERSARGMVPTAAGETLVPHARLLLFEMGQAADALDALKGLKAGVARIGAVGTIARSVLPPAIRRLLAAAPGLHVRLVEQPDDRLAEALLAREIDLMIGGAALAHPGLHAIGECRYDDVFAVFCAAGHALAGAVTLTDVLGERWTMPAPGATPRDLFQRIVAAAGGRMPDIAVETGSLDLMVRLVAESDLLGWLPSPLLAGAVAAGAIRVLEVPELAVRRRFLVYRRTDGLLPPPAARLLDMLPIIERNDP
ncbi:MAG: LysR family transcriptional regulator [Sphingomonas fennica]